MLLLLLCTKVLESLLLLEGLLLLEVLEILLLRLLLLLLEILEPLLLLLHWPSPPCIWVHLHLRGKESNKIWKHNSIQTDKLSDRNI